jgi:uncharacterized protein
MAAVLADTGLFVALFCADDLWHDAAMSLMDRLDQQLITTIPVVTDATHFLQKDHRTLVEFLEWLPAAVDIDAATLDDLPAIRRILAKYRDLPADFADASLVALADRIHVYDVAAVDADFTVYRGAGRKRFRNLLRP